ncbi:MAG TPA: hypothetical protein VGD17_14595 [Chitinophagaceae bacterium]
MSDQKPETDLYEEKLYELYTHSSQEFDKHLLYIATSALGITFAFIEKIVPLKDASNTNVLFAGWLGLTGTIILFLLSHRVSQRQTESFIKEYKRFKCGEIDKEMLVVFREGFNRKIRSYNSASALLLILGIISILLFLWLNLN